MNQGIGLVQCYESYSDGSTDQTLQRIMTCSEVANGNGGSVYPTTTDVFVPPKTAADQSAAAPSVQPTTISPVEQASPTESVTEANTGLLSWLQQNKFIAIGLAVLLLLLLKNKNRYQ